MTRWLTGFASAMWRSQPGMVAGATVSYHFRGKQELLTQACLGAFGDAVPFEAFAALGSVEELIEFVASELDQGLADNAALTRLMRETERDEALHEQMRAMLARYRQAVIAMVRADQQRGVLPKDVAAEGIATALVAIGDGLLLHALLDPGLDVRGALHAVRSLLVTPRRRPSRR